MEQNEKFDPVNNPKHYNSYSREVIELTEHMDFCTGNACKYILRAPFKGKEAQDLKKAIWYLKRIMSNKWTPTIDQYVMAVKDDFDSPLFKEVFDVLVDAAMNETPVAIKGAIALIEKRLHEIEIEELRKEVLALRSQYGKSNWDAARELEDLYEIRDLLFGAK